MNRRPFSLFRILLVPLCAALLLPGCASAPQGSGQTALPSLHPAAEREWRVTVRNQTDRYVWLTRYWSKTALADWHVEGANCIAPHGEITEAIYYKAKFTNDEAKLRAEIKPATAGRTNCAGDANDVDVWGDKCVLGFKDSVIRAEAFVKRDGSNWTVPTSCKV